MYKRRKISYTGRKQVPEMTLFNLFLLLVFLLFQPHRPMAAERGIYLPTKQIAVLRGHGNQALFNPSDVVVVKDEVFVMDGVNDRVVVFDKKGKVLRTFGRKGPGGDHLDQSLGIAADRKGRIYVADSRRHRIVVFTREGRWLRSIDLVPFKSRVFPADPTDLVIDGPRRRMVIVDNDNHRLLVYSLSGKYLASWGTVGLGREQFSYPYSIDMDKRGRFYVCEVMNTRVQVLYGDGTFASMIGEWGVRRGQFFRPQGVALDRKQRVYVTDNFMGVVQVFDFHDGHLIGILADSKGKRYNFKVPTGLAFDDENNLYLVEMGEHRVRVFKLLF